MRGEPRKGALHHLNLTQLVERIFDKLRPRDLSRGLFAYKKKTCGSAADLLFPYLLSLRSFSCSAVMR